MLTQFSINEHVSVLGRIVDFCPTGIDPMTVKWYWDDSMDMDNGVLGAFRRPDRICLPKWGREQVLYGLEFIPTIVHELTHMSQYSRMGLLGWSARNIPFVREWTLEPEAEEAEMKIRIRLNLEACETNED